LGVSKHIVAVTGWC